ncbi:MAG: hypothetical protein JO257_04170 [Deltaproteobacteria bacterium]|nr:hypothetical protein [Deltaproteobacteria bacterium]
MAADAGISASDVLAAISAALTLIAVGISVISIALARETLQQAQAAQRENRAAANLERLLRLGGPLRDLQASALAAELEGRTRGNAYAEFVVAHRLVRSLLSRIPQDRLASASELLATERTPVKAKGLAEKVRKEVAAAVESESAELQQAVQATPASPTWLARLRRQLGA